MSGKYPKVIVFTTPSCPWCKRTKQYLQSRGVPFKEVNVASNQRAAQDMIRKSGQEGVPQLWIGSSVAVGFNQAKIDRLLGLK